MAVEGANVNVESQWDIPMENVFLKSFSEIESEKKRKEEVEPTSLFWNPTRMFCLAVRTFYPRSCETTLSEISFW